MAGLLAAFKHFSHLGSLFDPDEGGPSPPGNGYVAEDGVTYYVAEDGATYYVQES